MDSYNFIHLRIEIAEIILHIWIYYIHIVTMNEYTVYERIYDYMNINSKNQRIFWLANTKVDIELDKRK